MALLTDPLDPNRQIGDTFVLHGLLYEITALDANGASIQLKKALGAESLYLVDQRLDSLEAGGVGNITASSLDFVSLLNN